MNKSNRPALRFAVAAVAALLVAGGAAAQSSEFKSLRGVGVEDDVPVPPVTKLETPQFGFARAYRQQPPLVPHKVDDYQITPTDNQCMSCHDYPNNTKYGAMKISETHYSDREGNRLDQVAGTRYFCTACHVPQMDAKPLVGNTFGNTAELR